MSGLSDVTAIAAGGEFSLALLSNGHVMAWGQGEEGKLGDGIINNSNVPVEVTGLSEVTAISAGGKHALALQSDGRVKAWGSNKEGQLGNGGVNNGEETPGGSERTRWRHRDRRRRLPQPRAALERDRRGVGQQGSGQLGNGTKTKQPTRPSRSRA